MSAALPARDQVGQEILNIASTLSDEMQAAAIAKATESRYNLDAGRIPLQETLTNLASGRDLLKGAFNSHKLAQLPLKLQDGLLLRLRKVAETLQSLVAGNDVVVPLTDAVEDLTASIWTDNLHNLSGEFLGFEEKMNSLKTLEAEIRRVRKEAQGFGRDRDRAIEMFEQITQAKTSAETHLSSIHSAATDSNAVLTKITEQEQRGGALLSTLQQQDTAIAGFAATAKTTATESVAVLDRVKAVQVEVDGIRQTGLDLNRQTQDFLTSAESTNNAKRLDLESKVADTLSQLTNSANDQISAMKNHMSAIGVASNELSQRLNEADTNRETRVADFLTVKEHELREVAEERKKEFERLVKSLDELEGRIRESIERATGYSLFHSFQTRQLQLATSKRYWASALAAVICVSIAASAYLIYEVQAAQAYTPVFFMKFSISLPIIFAIAFCAVQYSRERRLEEEYAFKSNISISLEPYQKLVGTLVDKEKPEELSKYTTFIIESVSRVFSSPTEPIFETRSSLRSLQKVGKFTADLMERGAKMITKQG